MSNRVLFVALAAALLLTTVVVAEEVFFHRALGDLELTAGSLPATQEPTRPPWMLRQQARTAYAVLDAAGEVYLRYGFDTGGRNVADRFAREIAVRLPHAGEATGQLFLPQSDDEGMRMLRFRIPAEAAHVDARQDFYELKLEHYQALLRQRIPGAAWFRHHMRQARQSLGQAPDDPEPNETQFSWRRTGNLAETYALFTGGRAMSENLQLDRVLRVVESESNEEAVDVDSITGISIREIDWKPLIEGVECELDPLAAKIPADQHAIFFPSFNAAVVLTNEMAAHGTTILQLAEPRSSSARTLERYQHQLCLSITDIARLLGPKLAQSVALTGSDPYFRTGTDVAVLFETVQPGLLEELLMAQVTLAAAKHSDAEPVSGEIGELTYRGFRSADRRICSYVSKTDELVIVTNCPFQLEQLSRVASGQAESLAALDEFSFFRNRYRLREEGETAFLFLSDATIRRWCGPRWRIATSRRTRGAALMAEIQADHLDRLVSGEIQSGPIYTTLPVAGGEQLTLSADGVHSKIIGSLEFMTPIAEMNMNRVTQAEADAYRQWRQRYQSRWRWAFDPIGVRLGVDEHKLVGDLTVMPLIWGSEYRQFVSVSQGAQFKSNAGDQHDSLAHAILAINTESPMLQTQMNIARMMTGQLQLDPLSWLGESVSAYIDKDPFWDGFAEVSPDDMDEFMGERGWSIPFALRADVSNGFKLTAFLAAVRGFIEQATPGMLNWETLSYQDEPYVRVSPTERAVGRAEQTRNMALYYSASGDALALTLNEEVLKRSIDRELARRKARSEDQPAPVAKRPWLGSNLALQVDHKLLQVLASLGRREYQREMQTRAWGNIAILNEWRHRYPDYDPVALHEELWQVRLLCPGGGQYVWNDEYQTMESTIYGCPAAPRDGPIAAPLLNAVQRGDCGLTFEEQGLRARVSLVR